jgi:hypothetical protein
VLPEESEARCYGGLFSYPGVGVRVGALRGLADLAPIPFLGRGRGVDCHVLCVICGCFRGACGLSGLPRKQGKCDGSVKNFAGRVHFPLAGFGWWA